MSVMWCKNEASVDSAGHLESIQFKVVESKIISSKEILTIVIISIWKAVREIVAFLE